MITIPYTIPGERVRARVARGRDGALFGIVDEILEQSPHRVQPRCPHFGVPVGPAEAGHHAGCGGCSWQHIAYAEQLRLKSELVSRLVSAAVPRAPAALPTLPGTSLESPWGHRQKVHFVFAGAGRSPLVMGHYARGSRRVIPVVACPVHDERGNALAFRFRDALTRAGVTAADAPTVKGVAVRVAAQTAEMMATLVVTADADRRMRAATRRAIDGAAAPSSVHVNIHPRRDAYIFGRETRRISGSDRLREDVAGISFLISPTAFFQTNVRAAEVLVRLVMDAVTHPAQVLDLYAGAGLFALPLARAGNHVVAVEENRDAVADGDASRRLNGISEQHCRFVTRRVEDALRLGAARLAQGALGNRGFDAVVLDPPRAGCSESVIAGIFAKISPRRVVYVSCNPEALARDLRQIARCGYEVESLQPVDMFPHTAHVETVVMLSKRPRKMADKRGDHR